MGDVALSLKADDLERFAKVLRQHADGKELRKELAANLRKASVPIRDEARSAILSMSSHGLPHEDGEPIRQAIAKRIVVETRLTGRSTGVKIKAKRKGMPRGFEHAPKRFNRQSFRHPVFQREGRDPVWVEQVGKPFWFDDVMRDGRDNWSRGVHAAMEITADRINGKIRRG